MWPKRSVIVRSTGLTGLEKPRAARNNWRGVRKIAKFLPGKTTTCEKRRITNHWRESSESAARNHDGAASTGAAYRARGETRVDPTSKSRRPRRKSVHKKAARGDKW